ncbi:MAPEG family protein [Uliginosibacterium sp. H3]|uniref:MAPEG family protein n=1 Tax=Uliginosibacterium silvisoli TaxID=3114758 RepID=A0ABU6JYW2_9RHOO|nr:MAPEG family protein [Uliginosibacterium sp. H3]
MTHSAILPPMFAMVLVTMLVWVRLYVVRLAEMRAKRIRPQQIASSTQAASLLSDTQASDNFRNLFEVPVLFHVCCVLAFSAHAESTALVALAWTYAMLRALHSFIHCTYNRVMHRFLVYVSSTLVLFAMWGVLGFALLVAH